MTTDVPSLHSDSGPVANDRAVDELLAEQMRALWVRTDRIFAGLMAAQWIGAVLVAATVSPYSWAGRVHTTHAHVYAAVLLGGLISSAPIVLALTRPGRESNQYVIASAQMMWSALLIHLTGGRIETHFHVFGSLAFLAFYRNWKVLVPATIVVATDHLLRQMYWPESVYGILNPVWWRFLEHAGWVIFEDIVLVLGCVTGASEMRIIAHQQADLKATMRREQDKSAALDQALAALRASQTALVRSEKLAAVGQLAASVGHELRNPLGAVRNATTYVSKRVLDPKTGPEASKDARVAQFFGIIDRELNACTRIISDLLDFARDRSPALQPCPLKPLVDDAIAIVPKAAKVAIVNVVPDDLPVPNLDKDQMRQVLVNLVQNAVEAVGTDREGRVEVRAEGGGSRPFSIVIVDTGPGIPNDVIEKIFEPLFTTKTKGTGLGLAVVANLIKGHSGTIRAENVEGGGARFVIELPFDLRQAAA